MLAIAWGGVRCRKWARQHFGETGGLWVGSGQATGTKEGVEIRKQRHKLQTGKVKDRGTSHTGDSTYEDADYVQAKALQVRGPAQTSQPGNRGFRVWAGKGGGVGEVTTMATGARQPNANAGCPTTTATTRGT